MAHIEKHRAKPGRPLTPAGTPLGEVVRERMIERGLSLRAVVDKAGVRSDDPSKPRLTHSTVRNIIRESRSISDEVLHGLALALALDESLLREAMHRSGPGLVEYALLDQFCAFMESLAERDGVALDEAVRRLATRNPPVHAAVSGGIPQLSPESLEAVQRIAARLAALESGGHPTVPCP